MKRIFQIIAVLLMMGCSSTLVTPATTSTRVTLTDLPPSQETKESVSIKVFPEPDNTNPNVVELDGHVAELPPGLTGELTISSSVIDTEEGVIKESEVEATGPGIRTASDSIAENISLEAPISKANGAMASGGALAFEAKYIGKSSTGMTIIYVIGGLCVVAGVAVVFVVKRLMLGLGISGAGLLLLAVGRMLEVYPWVSLIGLAVAIGLVVWFVLDSRASKQKDIALRTVVKAIEVTPDTKAITDNVQSVSEVRHEDRMVKNVITKIKGQL